MQGSVPLVALPGSRPNRHLRLLSGCMQWGYFAGRWQAPSSWPPALRPCCRFLGGLIAGVSDLASETAKGVFLPFRPKGRDLFWGRGGA
jgi:hypothetical protein